MSPYHVTSGPALRAIDGTSFDELGTDDGGSDWVEGEVTRALDEERERRRLLRDLKVGKDV